MTTYTSDHVEAALCAWEWMLQNEDMLKDAWESVGTPTMRMHCATLGPYIDEVYKYIPENVRDSVTFDWNVVPQIMMNVDFLEDGTLLFPSAVTMAGVVSRELKEMAA